MQNHFKYIIYAPAYDENSGGSIALHKLCHVINQAGEKAYLWPIFDQSPVKKNIINRLKHYLLTKRRLYIYKKKRCRNFITPLAQKHYLDDSAIVIYPEIIHDNPLGVKKVVRWLLYKSDDCLDNEGDLFFHYQSAFKPSSASIKSERLKITHVKFDTYQQRNFGKRSGNCYMMRKDQERELVHDLDDSVCIDGLSDREIARYFNSKKYFISYDPYTMYSRYAALCGCISICIPKNGVVKELWRPEERLRYGIAYGLNDIQYAKSTMHKVKESLVIEEKENFKEVQFFIDRCTSYFSELL